jgi:hypothetical protein
MQYLWNNRFSKALALNFFWSPKLQLWFLLDGVCNPVHNVFVANVTSPFANLIQLKYPPVFLRVILVDTLKKSFIHPTLEIPPKSFLLIPDYQNEIHHSCL